ncbi:hypothetical protein FXN61_25740 [Lentzea sp. PSKA42]|uniref:Siderophore-interacting FAD-binding domain-containing protein n=1 Tax=Lentzea indica TaxID=2604800 RepID=A0ABX1FN94_9PSEU|nr:hypothetical protein [Lentzea indica]
MPRYSAFDRFTLKAATKAAEMLMAPANRREVFDQFVMTATAVTELSEHMRRITFHAPELASFAVTGPDEYFGLLMATGRELVMPPDDRINVRSSLRAMPEDERPDLRWYTVRAHRRDVAEIDAIRGARRRGPRHAVGSSRHRGRQGRFPRGRLGVPASFVRFGVARGGRDGAAGARGDPRGGDAADAGLRRGARRVLPGRHRGGVGVPRFCRTRFRRAEGDPGQDPVHCGLRVGVRGVFAGDRCSAASGEGPRGGPEGDHVQRVLEGRLRPDVTGLPQRGPRQVNVCGSSPAAASELAVTPVWSPRCETSSQQRIGYRPPGPMRARPQDVIDSVPGA